MYKRLTLITILTLFFTLPAAEATQGCTIQRSKKGADLVRFNGVISRYDKRGNELGMKLYGFAGTSDYKHIKRQGDETVAVLAYQQGVNGDKLRGYTIHSGDLWISGILYSDRTEYVIAKAGRIVECSESRDTSLKVITRHLQNSVNGVRTTKINVPAASAVFARLGL